ncbi:YgiQ family radical SAM protein [Maribrevibacterium harenarium]|uniref:YgiQ family radical SAM protein n=1 Tax=Maribrevibacterium harenarium TaxID=2589817 RepID=A0A501X1X1_9GAMM|nr:YgiQ family radical SAM protein [Maribrevibacterium harenarium]TPE54479.1 YgiQ family radical SAM protein [Maribrevibacterium harenarium]
MSKRHKTAPDLFSYPPYWAECYGVAPFLPTTRAEMDALGWDSCDVIIVTGDAYVDHPSFGMAVMGRVLEAQGFRVGIIDQPDWRSPDDFMRLGRPNLYFGVTAGNMDSMINRYTADRKVRNDDAYTPYGMGGKRPDRAVIVYSQRCKQAFHDVPVMIGGIEASLRRIAQYDYWADEVRRSVLIDSTADILLYGNAERAIIEVTHALAAGKTMDELTDVRGTTIVRDTPPGGFTEIDSTRVDWPGKVDQIYSPYEYIPEGKCQTGEKEDDDVMPIRVIPAPLRRGNKLDEAKTYIRLPSFDKVAKDPVLYAHASRVLHLESNPHNARALIQKHGKKEIWVNPPPIPLETPEMDGVFGLPYARVPHPKYKKARIPAYDMIKTSINIMRGCFGGCTFCSITEHEGRVIQSRSHESILNEIEDIKAKVPGFTGHISDLGGPTSNMYTLNCKDDEIQASCRKLSCVYPEICVNLKTDHSATTELYRKARAVEGVHTVSIASGLRYDLAVEDPEYVRELVTYHVGGLLKIAPEHSEEGTLAKMMKPGMGTYDRFKRMFDKFSREAGKTQHLIPYFIAAHPGSSDEDMLNLALWLKKNDFKPDQVQTFYPSPMSLATAMYHSGKNPLGKVTYKSENVETAKDYDTRTVHKGFLRYHDPKNWPALRDTLKKMGRADLIGHGANKLVPPEEEDKRHGRRPVKAKPGQQTGASHSSNRPTNEKNREAERRRQKQSGGNSSVVATSNKPAAPRPSGSKSKSRKSR